MGAFELGQYGDRAVDRKPRQALWARSAAWRWLFAAAVLSSGLVLVAGRWRSTNVQFGSTLSVFDPAKVMLPPQLSVPVVASGQPVPSMGRSDQADQLVQHPATPAKQTSFRPPVAATEPLSGNAVVWSNRSGGISGGGLIAAYCCAGAMSTATANRAVQAGRHYWELTLSVRPGEQSPDTWTNAGVTTDTTLSSSPGSRALQLTGRNGTTSFLAINWGQKRQFRNGDVFMFALDADQGLLYHGVNGQWHNGRPGESGGEPIGSPGVALTPFVNISASSAKAGPEGDRWIANFGASQFKFPVPSTFVAYGTGLPAQPSSGATISRAGELRGGSSVHDNSGSPLNRLFEDEVTVGGQRVPLPLGVWVGLAYFRGQAGSTQGDSVVLGRIVKDRVAGVVAINAHSSANSANGYPAFSGCDRTDYVHASRQVNEALGPQRCWWINHASQVWDQPIFRAAKGVLEQRSLSTPAVLVNVAFRRASTRGFTTAFYYFNPEEAGISSEPSAWNMSAWHKDRISEDARRIAYVKDLRGWGENWAPVFYATDSK